MVRGSWKTVIRDVDRLYTEGTAAGWSDDQLLARYITARDDSNTVFETIVRRHGPMVLEVCRRLLGNYDDAQDAFQATFLVLARRAGSIAPHPSQSLGPWLYQVASRTAWKARGTRHRREAREHRAASRSETTIEAEASNSLDHDEYQVLHEEVAKLPEKYRAAVVLCYFEGLTHDQAAASLRWPVGTVRGYLARARDLLRIRLVRRGVAPASAIIMLDSGLCSASMLTPPLIESVLQAIGKGAAASAVAALSGSIVRGLAIERIRRLLLAFTVLALGVGGSGLAALRLRGSTDPQDPARPKTRSLFKSQRNRSFESTSISTEILFPTALSLGWGRSVSIMVKTWREWPIPREENRSSRSGGTAAYESGMLPRGESVLRSEGVRSTPTVSPARATERPCSHSMARVSFANGT